MGGPSRLYLLVIVSVLRDYTLSRSTTLNPFPLGTIGCLVSDVCGSGEICTNDLLFGSCQSIFSRALNGENKFRLGTEQIQRLMEEIQYLIKAEFTWKDAYTQCILQNILVEFSRGRSFDRRLCEDALGVASAVDWSEDANDEIANVLLQLLESEDANMGNLQKPSENDRERGVDFLNSNKRDEIVQVHKYFDRSTGQLKRDPFFDGQASSYSQLYRNQNPEPYSLYYSRAWQPREDNEEDTYPVFDTSDGRMQLSLPDVVPTDGESQNRDLMSILGSDQENVYRQDNLINAQDLNLLSEKGVPEFGDVQENLILTPEDEKTFEALLEGTVSAEDLDPVQQERLRVFIEGLIRVLEDNDDNLRLADDLDEVLPLPQTPVPEDVVPNDLALSEDVADNLPEEVVFPDRPVNDEGLEESVEGVQSPEVPEVVDPEKLSMAQDVLVNKKMIGEGEEEDAGENPTDDVDDKFSESLSGKPTPMYLELSKELDGPEGFDFVRNLTDILKLPPSLLYLARVNQGNLLNLDVYPDPKGEWNAERIATEAKSQNAVLKERTGITVEAAGVDQDGKVVDVNPNNRYVVLTFIAVGTIAGVVLAVLTIYLIKRHSRSKQKLAQLASNGDGNEASKDYQDLCRQRMQGKTSEKPEPLHAASRIGSVSENQVRSPSSRSSTSSWSEEPAATNMDISTGHIVLSYMEDHLKNQDRLDREWEAVSGYVADPSSTKMANDQSNMRKNRFADILPYDHSRVVLSSNANVSNSDYINASFITDHDPRNPAYICTQGPLPHTVADFWQMIWEQGSVVIVMLTKLAENGTTLCHRYWPEEGSDLYHIYEVHLVSEHIWCDDYLVRSFYLKNLQTNETRTVTQFHFLTWPELSVPASIKALLDFRRKVNKSFRGRSCPIVVHCGDGCGRSGTYCLIDMVLNKMAKGAKEIDMAATLEHIRDQRMSMVKTKEQFQFSLAAVAEEVHAILKALPQ